jgi:hypothetical protein
MLRGFSVEKTMKLIAVAIAASLAPSYAQGDQETAQKKERCLAVMHRMDDALIRKRPYSAKVDAYYAVVDLDVRAWPAPASSRGVNSVAQSVEPV